MFILSRLMNTVYRIAFLTMVLAGIAAAGDSSLPVPEIGVGSATAAVGVLGGMLLVMRARRKK